MRITALLCLMGIWLGLSSQLMAEEGKLESIRREVETSDPPSSSDSSSDCSSHKGWSLRFGGSSDCDDDDDSLSAKFVFFAITSPWWGPKLALEGDEGSLIAAFPPAPYTTHDGYLSLDEPRLHTDGWGGRISLDNGSNFDDITSLSGRLRLDTTHRWGLDSEWVWLHERQPLKNDNLVRGDANIVYRFAQSERAQFHSGIGLNWLAGSGDADLGFNFTYGADFFPVDPVIISSTLDLGTIGHSSLVHFRSTLGLMVVDRLHLYSGYDMLNFSGQSIHSLISGIELWF